MMAFPISETLTQLRHVLVVDDEEHIALLLQEGLAKLPNCEVTAATGGAQGLQFFAQRPFDLLITDYKMPGMDGIALANQIRQQYPQTPVILLSACTDEIDEIIEEQKSNIVIQHVLDKPVKLADIRTITLETLEKKSDKRSKSKGSKISYS